MRRGRSTRRRSFEVERTLSVGRASELFRGSVLSPRFSLCANLIKSCQDPSPNFTACCGELVLLAT